MKTQKLLALVLLVIMPFVMGCSQALELNEEPQNASQDIETKDAFSEFGLLSYPNGVITVEDFLKTNNIIKSQEEYDQAKDNGEIASSPDVALVSLLFSGGVLLTPHEYNYRSSKDNLVLDDEILVTDIKTFHKVTGLKSAHPDYANVLGETWIFDPYVKYYKTRQEVNNWIEKEKVKQSCVSALRAASSEDIERFLTKGHILYRGNATSITYFVGHTACIANNILASYPNINTTLKNLPIIEAMPGHGVWRTKAKEWATWDTSNRAVVSPNFSMLPSVRDKIIAFHEEQLGKEYEFIDGAFWAEKRKNSKDDFYCSKLQWMAYKEVLGIDIDGDRGPWVFPNDILESPYMSVTYF